MPSVFIIGDTNMAKKKKSHRRRRMLGAASGKCKTIRRKGGRTQQLCHTGKGITGWTLMPMSRRR